MLPYLPPEAEEFTLTERSVSPYPPIGFAPFQEHELGNGDVYGLYWPVGREGQSPLVFVTYHDEWSVGPNYSSVASFLRVASRVQDHEYVPDPEPAEDPDSPILLIREARERQRVGRLDEALPLIERALTILPEFTEARVLLLSHLRRLRRVPEACLAAVEAIRSPRSLGDATPAATWLSKQPLIAELSGDPIFASRQHLSLAFGGVKTNAQYPLLLEAIDQYERAEQFVAALNLLQSYGEYMYSETTAFQERYNFSLNWFGDRYRGICDKAGLPDRTVSVAA
jgi:tetratricopeptide (TPR) repeat protein